MPPHKPNRRLISGSCLICWMTLMRLHSSIRRGDTICIIEWTKATMSQASKRFFIRSWLTPISTFIVKKSRDLGPFLLVRARRSWAQEMWKSWVPIWRSVSRMLLRGSIPYWIAPRLGIHLFENTMRRQHSVPVIKWKSLRNNARMRASCNWRG